MTYIIFKDKDYIIVKQNDTFQLISQADYITDWHDNKVNVYSHLSASNDNKIEDIVGGIHNGELCFKHDLSADEKQLTIRFVQNLIIPTNI